MMIGLYILSTTILKQLKTIKFGMSMRLNQRLFDYLIVFGDSTYEYYYEFENIYTREEILSIESEILCLHEKERNLGYQTEYFYCDNIESFHDGVILLLDKKKIKYKFHKGHNFKRENYDNNPEPFVLQVNKTNIIKLDRFGQSEAYEEFKKIFNQQKYWGLMIAPTGWGKTLMHLVFFGHYLNNNNDKNVVLITKKKDLLNDINNDIINDIDILHKSQFFNFIPHIEYCVDDKFDSSRINNLNKPSIIIINIDKIINKKTIKNKKYDPLKKIKTINWNKIGFLIFDEVHHIGSDCASTLMEYLKNDIKLKYCIGSSATPVRNNFDNQNNIRLLFNKSDKTIIKAEINKEDLNILHEITYMEAWNQKIILPIKIELIKLKDVKIEIKENNKKIHYTYSETDKQTIINKILLLLKKSYKGKIIFYTSKRLSCLEWYKYISNNIGFKDYSKYISFSITDSSDILSDNMSDEINDNTIVNNKIKELNITKEDLNSGIENFKKNNDNSFLFVVNKATEGYNDKFLDIVFNLDPVLDRSIVLELQKMGRTTRIIDGKETGIYVCPIINSENYLENMTDFIANFLKTIMKPINDKQKNDDTHLPTQKEYNNIYNKIFNIEGFTEIEYNNIYNTTLRKLSPDITYKNAIKIIKESDPKPKTKEEYIELCNMDSRLPKEPEKFFNNFNWIEYLSISKNFYTLENCKTKINEYTKSNTTFMNKLPSEKIKVLCGYYDMFPPYSLFTEYYEYYYNVKCNELFKVQNNSKTVNILSKINHNRVINL